MSDCEYKVTKPVLKRNCIHLRNNVIVTWKSIEIWPILQEENEVKILNPVYVPVNELLSYMDMTKP